MVLNKPTTLSLAYASRLLRGAPAPPPPPPPPHAPPHAADDDATDATGAPNADADAAAVPAADAAAADAAASTALDGNLIHLGGPVPSPLFALHPHPNPHRSPLTTHLSPSP